MSKPAQLDSGATRSLVSLSDGFLASVAHILSQTLKQTVQVYGSYPLSGGSIHQAARLDTSLGPYFIKSNQANQKPNFEAEARGLTCLRKTNIFDIPTVVTQGIAEGTAFLILDFIDAGSRQPGYWSDFGAKLAQLHRQTQVQFGLDHANYIGSLPQNNPAYSDWADFYREARLKPLVAQAHFTRAEHQTFERLYQALPDIFPKEPPALLHGDLWSGNVMVNRDGRVTLIDPAVYYGHREMELAFTQLFGGFAPDFYRAYQDVYPLAPGWQNRVGICQLYPLLVHYILFGSGYLVQIQQILKPF